MSDHFAALDQWMKDNPPNKNPMVQRLGLGPKGEKCKNCGHLVVHGCSKRFFKCTIRGDTRGPGTDHRLSYDACPHFKRRDKVDEARGK